MNSGSDANAGTRRLRWLKVLLSSPWLAAIVLEQQGTLSWSVLLPSATLATLVLARGFWSRVHPVGRAQVLAPSDLSLSQLCSELEKSIPWPAATRRLRKSVARATAVSSAQSRVTG